MLTQAKSHQRKILLLCSLGGLLEFYDFIISALLAGYIATTFFPMNANINGLLAAFATFSVSYFARPLGGIIFGHFGDIYGRKHAFTVSVLMMAIGTFCIGLIPNYNSIGIYAPLLLILCKMLQGFSIGGEIPGAITYISEFFPYRKAFTIGIVFCFLISGITMGYLVLAGLKYFYTQESIVNWAWRIPFFIGGVFGIIAFYLRKKLIEIPEFQPYLNPKQPFPLIEVIKNHWQVSILGALLTGFGAIVIISLFTFLPVYLTKILNYNPHHLMWIIALFVFISALSCILFGWISDRVNNRVSLLILLVIGTGIFAFPIFYTYIHHFIYYPFVLFVSALLVGLCWGNIPAIFAEFFPHQVRYSGIGLSYNLGFGIIGGLAPLILLSSIKWSGTSIAPAYVLVLSSIIILLALLIFKHAIKPKK
ncbi:MFS transporter [uncultured Shewanella sp.]|uniref:MFS transporter n=1 Tax=uncultured Shewanella sp. TaxID=173975 RepID=UPI002603CF64|nr:MFS transporter [uncultured Shewanella sp.]